MIVLNTEQTVAMAGLGNLNYVQLKKIRSFLWVVGQVILQYSEKELQRIDVDVGNDRTAFDTSFGTITYEWCQTKGKEKKPPEEVNDWNSSLLREIEAEIDIYLCMLFLKESVPDSNATIPTIDYNADGFDKPGITILIGGDHGDGHCPITAKLNLSSPAERKEKKDLGYGCPIIQFASVECTKDAYELLDLTIMPKIKREITELDTSAVLTVFDCLRPRQAYHSFIVPSTIHLSTIAFTEAPKTLRFAYSGHSDEPPGHRVIQLDDVLIFKDISHLQLSAKLVVRNFNQLYVGDLAFLAMLIGMNNSAGDHCLLCMHKGSEFNCDHSSMERRTKEKLDIVDSYQESIRKSTETKRSREDTERQEERKRVKREEREAAVEES
jgi:hypothetical protein